MLLCAHYWISNADPFSLLLRQSWSSFFIWPRKVANCIMVDWTQFIQRSNSWTSSGWKTCRTFLKVCVHSYKNIILLHWNWKYCFLSQAQPKKSSCCSCRCVPGRGQLPPCLSPFQVPDQASLLASYSLFLLSSHHPLLEPIHSITPGAHSENGILQVATSCG